MGNGRGSAEDGELLAIERASHALGRYRYLIYAVAFALLGAILVLLVRGGVDSAWNPIDYDNFREYGANLLNDRSQGYLYPLPTILWVFAPLSLAPDWFVYVWVAVPFIVSLYLFGRQGILVWLAPPLLMHAALGQLDGWFLLPLFWLMTEHKTFAAPSAAVLMFKPQLGLFIVPFMCLKWLRQRQWPKLSWFTGTILLLNLPALLIDPDWLLDFLPRAQWRATQPLLFARGASVWAWWWRPGWSRGMLPLILLVILFLFSRAYRRHPHRAVFLLGLLLTPMLFPLSFTTVIAALPAGLPGLLLFTGSSWLALFLDYGLGGWGGVYVLVPMSTLWLLSRQAVRLDSR